MMIAFLVFKEINVLKIAVDVGFVVGITAATRPIGSAIFLIPNALSSSITPHVLYLYMHCKYISACIVILITLSSTIPIPVSSTAIFANGIRILFAAKAASKKILSTTASLIPLLTSSLQVLHISQAYLTTNGYPLHRNHFHMRSHFLHLTPTCVNMPIHILLFPLSCIT